MNKQSPSIAKITRPVQRKVVKRNNLFGLIDKFRSGSAIWISGAAGAGKTSFVSDYLSSNKLSNIWYHVDEGDSDPTTFFHYMGLAGKKAAPKRKNPLPHLTPEYMMGLPTFTRRFFEELYGRLKTPFCIVLDNIQNLAEGSPLHDLLSIALAEVPEGGCVIIISRENPPIQYSRLKANGTMAVIDQKDLLLSPDESSEIIKLRGGGSDKKTALALHERSGGWATGLTLLVESFKADGMDSVHSDTSNHAELFDYFTNEIFHMADKETQEFLMKTALFPKITKRMAEKIVGDAKADKTLSKLMRNNYFINRRAGRESVYQYHDLFREFLLARLTEHFPSSQIIELKQTAGAILDEAGYSEDAAILYLEAGDWESLSGFIQRNAQEFLMQGRNSLLEGWVKSLPQEVIDNNPWLLYWLGTVCIPMNVAEGLTYFERSFKLFSKSKDPMGIYLSWAGAVMSIFYSFNDYKEFDRWIEILGELQKKYPIPSAEIETFVARGMLYYIIFRNPGYHDANNWIKRALSLSRKGGIPNIIIEAVYLVVFYHTCIGESPRAENLIKEITEITNAPGVPPFSKIITKVTGSWYNWSRANVEESLRLVNEGLAISEESGVRVMDSNLLGGGAASTLATCDLEGAQGFLDKLSFVLSGGSTMDISFYNILSVWHALLQGDLTKAHQYLKDSKEIIESTGSPVPIVLSHFGHSLVFFERGEKRKALEQLEITRQLGREMKNHLIEYMCLLCDARFALEDGANSVGLKALKNALVLAKAHELAYYYFFQPDVMARLYVRALDEGIEVEYVQKMIRKCNLVPDPPPTECEKWPWPVMVYTLGRFELRVDGKTFKAGRKAQQRPLDLLKALVALGGRKVKDEELQDALWPDVDGDMAGRTLSATIHRLRQMLGTEKAVVKSAGSVTLDPRYCWVDRWAFERLLGKADMAIKEGSLKEAADFMVKANALYQGTFLKGRGEHWNLSSQEKLRNKFLHSIEKVGQMMETNGKLEIAVDFYRKGVETDPLAETFYRCLMRTYQNLGRRAEALALYGRLKKILANNLNIEPSPETEAVLREIKLKKTE